MMGASIGMKRLFLSIFFIGLLAAPVLFKQSSALRTVGSGPDVKSTALSRYGFFLEETAHHAGIDFVHEAPVLDPKLAPIMPEMAALGASVLSSITTATAGPISMCSIAGKEVKTRSTTTFATGRSKMSRRSWVSQTSIELAAAYPRVRSGETTTMTVTKTCY